MQFCKGNSRNNLGGGGGGGGEPWEVNLSQGFLREAYLNYNPFLVLFIDDIERTETKAQGPYIVRSIFCFVFILFS